VRGAVIAFTFLFILSTSNVFSANYKAYRTQTPPTIDGLANEECWQNARWAFINQPFDGKALPDSADFHGRYKVVWDAARVYVLMEITDDKLVDNRVNPKDNYWQDDIAEFFFDEDYIKQGHECGTEAFNAFAYHIAGVPCDKNNYTNGSIVPFDAANAVHHVIDLGADCNTANALNLDDHVKMKISKNGNKYSWELEFKIFDKNYNQNISTNIPVTLTPNKVMGFAIAYCDDDSGVRDNMIGTVANHNDYSGKYPFFQFTNEYETLTLNDSVLSVPTAIHSPSILKGAMFWPNPAGNTISFKINDIDNHFNQIDIYNLAGMTVLSQNWVASQTSIDVSLLRSGNYILGAFYTDGQYLQHFIKE